MKKNKSKKLILAAMLFFSGGVILPLGKQEIVNAAQEEQINQENEILDGKEMENQEQGLDGMKSEEGELKEEEEGIEDNDGEEEKEEEIETKDDDEEREEEIEKKDEDEEEKEEGIENKDEDEEEKEEGIEEKDEKDEDKGAVEEKEGMETAEDEDKKEEQNGEEMEEDEENQKVGNAETEKREEEEGENLAKEEDLKTEETSEEDLEIAKGKETMEESEEYEKVADEATENLIEHFMQSAEVPENIVVQQIILPTDETKDPSFIVTNEVESEKISEQVVSNSSTVTEKQEKIIEQAKETLAVQGEEEKKIEIEGKETFNEALVEESLYVEILEDIKPPVVTIENILSSDEKKEIRFHYQMEDENLVEYQIKVFFTSGGKEELIWQENTKTEGELSFEKEGNYLVYLYAKDSSGNESRTYQNYSLGSFQLELEELNKFENQEVVLEEMETLLENVFEGSNVATYQLYINGEQYKGETSQIPEGKCILTVEMEDTNGNSGQKTMEIVAVNTKEKEEMTEKVREKEVEDGDNGDKEKENEQIQNEEGEQNEKGKGTSMGKSAENEKDSSVPIQAAGILGSLISGMLIFFRRIKH